MNTINKLSMALDYADRGWAVMPLKPNKKDPHFDLIKGAYLGASTDKELIKFWFDVDPKANLGIACAPSNLVVIDVDFRNGGQYLPEMGETYTVKTGDGFHYYYQVMPGMNFAGTLDEGIDVKFKGYVAAPPSIHPNGSAYEVVSAIDPIVIPAELYEMVGK